MGSNPIPTCYEKNGRMRRGARFVLLGIAASALCAMALLWAQPAEALGNQYLHVEGGQDGITTYGGYIWLKNPPNPTIKRPLVELYCENTSWSLGLEKIEKYTVRAPTGWVDQAIAIYPVVTTFHQNNVQLYNPFPCSPAPGGYTHWPPYYASGDHFVTRVRFHGAVYDPLFGFRITSSETKEASDVWKRDLVPPDGSISINAGAETTTSPQVTLTLWAEDPLNGEPSRSDLQWMHISNDDNNWSTYSKTSGTSSLQWTLAGTGAGPRTVYAQFQDHVGHRSGSYSDTIFFNRPPTYLQPWNLAAPPQAVTNLVVRDNDPNNTLIGTVQVEDLDKIGGDSFAWVLQNVEFGNRFKLGSFVSAYGDGTSEVQILIRSAPLIDYQLYGPQYAFDLTVTDLQAFPEVPGTAYVQRIYVDVEDWTKPNCISIVPDMQKTGGTYGPTNATSVAFNVQFDEGVRNFDLFNDVMVTSSGDIDVPVNLITITPVDAANYIVEVSGMSGTGGTYEGTISLQVRTTFPGNITDLWPGITTQVSPPVPGNPLESSVTSEVVYLNYTTHRVAVEPPSPALTRTGPINFAVVYEGADPSTINLTTADIILHTTGTVDEGAITVDVFDGTTPNPTVRLSNISGDGQVWIETVAGTSYDYALPPNADTGSGPSARCIVDNTAPAITRVTGPSAYDTNSGPVTYELLYGMIWYPGIDNPADPNYDPSYTNAYDADIVTLNEADVTLLRSGTANGVVTVNVTQLYRAYSAVITISDITGDGTLGIDVGAFTATDNAGNMALAPATPPTFNVDNTRPTVVLAPPQITWEPGDQPPAPPSGHVNALGTVTLDVTYTGADFVQLGEEDVILVADPGVNLAGIDVSVNGGTTLSPQIVLGNIEGNGNLNVTIPAGLSGDVAGNVDTGPGISYNLTVDNTPPAVALQAPNVYRANNSTTVSFPIGYSHTPSPDVNLDVSDISLDVTETVNAGAVVIEVLNGTTLNPTIRISNLLGDGQIRLFVDPGTAVDDLGNPAPGVGPSEWVTVDNTGPTITYSDPNPAVGNIDTLFELTMVYSADAQVRNLTVSDIIVNVQSGSGLIGSCDLEVVHGTSPAPTIRITNCDGDGKIWLSIAPGTCQDDLGNPDIGPSNTPPLISIYNSKPVVAIRTPRGSPTNRFGTVTTQIDYGGVDLVVDLTTDDVFLTHIDGDDVTQNVVVTVQPGPEPNAQQFVKFSNLQGDGRFSFGIYAGTARDIGGNEDTGDESIYPIEADNTGPGISIGAPSPASTVTGPVEYRVNFFDAVEVDLDPSDIHVIAADDTELVQGVDVDVSVGGSGLLTRTVTINNIQVPGGMPPGYTLGSVHLHIDEGAAFDYLNPMSGQIQGNPSAAADSDPVMIDSDPPQVLSITPTRPTPTNGTYMTYDVVFDEGVENLNLANDLVINTTGTAVYDLAFVSQNAPDSYEVTITGLGGDGVLTFWVKTLAEGGHVRDTAGNYLQDIFVSPDVVIDNTPPSVEVLGPDVEETVNGPVVFTVNYPDIAIVNLSEAYVQINKTGNVTVGAMLIAEGTKDTATWTVTLSDIQGGGSVGIEILPGSGEDAAGNLALGSGPSNMADVVAEVPMTWWPLALALVLVALAALTARRRTAKGC